MPLDTYTPINDVGAVNRLLEAIGESPLASLGSGSPDELAARNILEDESRHVQQMERWKFNAGLAYEIAPTGTHLWTYSDGTTETLNVFQLPTGVIRWSVTPTAAQLDLTLARRLPENYDSGGAEVLYDVVRNRDGLPQAAHPYLYLDLAWYTSWVRLPDSVRNYVIHRGVRRFVVQSTSGKGTEPSWLERDTMDAWRTLLRDQKLPGNPNILDHPDNWAMRGRRRGSPYRYARETHSR